MVYSILPILTFVALITSVIVATAIPQDDGDYEVKIQVSGHTVSTGNYKPEDVAHFAYDMCQENFCDGKENAKTLTTFVPGHSGDPTGRVDIEKDAVVVWAIGDYPGWEWRDVMIETLYQVTKASASFDYKGTGCKKKDPFFWRANGGSHCLEYGNIIQFYTPNHISIRKQRSSGESLATMELYIRYVDVPSNNCGGLTPELTQGATIGSSTSSIMNGVGDGLAAQKGMKTASELIKAGGPLSAAFTWEYLLPSKQHEKFNIFIDGTETAYVNIKAISSVDAEIWKFPPMTSCEGTTEMAQYKPI